MRIKEVFPKKTRTLGIRSVKNNNRTKKYGIEERNKKRKRERERKRKNQIVERDREEVGHLDGEKGSEAFDELNELLFGRLSSHGGSRTGRSEKRGFE